MKPQRVLAYQILAWGLLFGYNTWWVVVRSSAPSLIWYKLVVLQLTFWLSITTLFYYCLLLVFPQGIRRRRLPLLAGGLLLTPGVFAGTRYGLEEVLLPRLLGFHNYAPGTTLRYYLLDNLYYLVPTVAVAAVTWGVREAFVFRDKERQSQLALQLLQQEKTQAELAFLKTQLNPHFLYNTLNYLYAEAYAVSEPLARAVLRLSDLMRYMLHESPDGQVLLRQEVEYLENYLALHRLRFEGKFFVCFRQPSTLAAQRIASLLLVPFVENALKHGILHRPDQPVTICLSLPTPDRLCFEVRNHISHQQKDGATGIGLPNIRRRLDLLYAGRHQLAVHDDGVVHHTRLELTLTPTT